MGILEGISLECSVFGLDQQIEPIKGRQRVQSPSSVVITPDCSLPKIQSSSIPFCEPADH